MSNYSFSLIEPCDLDWDDIESCPDCTVFHTRQWDNYLASLGRKHFILSIAYLNSPNHRIGYFIATIRYIGIKIMGSPDGGAGTYVQGLCMKEEISSETRVTLYQDLVHYIFENKIASYVQISDWKLALQSSEWIPPQTYHYHLPTIKGFHQVSRSTLFIDTSIPEDQLWANLKYKSCRYCINKARKLGLHIRTIDNKEDIPYFVDTLSDLIQNVSQRKHERRHIHHSKKYLLTLCKSLFPNKILMIQVLGNTDDGVEHVMSSAIFCIGHSASTYFSGASNEKYMKYCPNELMVWEGLKILSKRGAGDLILGGVASYKKKFGSSYAFLPMMVFSRYPIVRNLRTTLKKIYNTLRQTI